MDEEDQIMYIYALDLRIAEFQEEVDHIRSGSKKPLVETASIKLMWNEMHCPLCWLYRDNVELGMECLICPAGDENDAFCGEYIKNTDAMLDFAEDKEHLAEMYEILIEKLKEQRNRVVRRQPLALSL